MDRPPADMVIEASGQLTTRDLRIAARAVRTWWWYARSGVIFLMVAAVGYLSFRDDHIVVAVFLAIGAIAALILPTSVQRVMIGQALAKTPLLQGKQQWRIDDERLQVMTMLLASASAQNVVGWSDIQSLRVVHNSALLMLNRSQCLLLPRRFFRSERDWQTFQQMARSSISRARADITSAGAPGSSEGLIDLPANGIRASGVLSVRELIRATFLHRNFRMNQTIVLLTLLGCMVLLSLMPSSYSIGKWLLVGCIATVTVIGQGIPRFTVWLAYRRDPTIIEIKGVLFHREGIFVFRRNIWSWIPWAGMPYYRHQRDLFVLSFGEYTMLPIFRRFFTSEDDWNRTLLLVHRNLGQCVKCKYALRGSTSNTCPECGAAIEAPKRV